MMGTKIRSFAPLARDVSLEDLVAKDNFYRRLEERLDLSFVRDLVAPLYARGGRPCVDLMVFCRLQLGMFFEGVRSERELMRVAADRLSVRWYLGYDLHEPLPDHSSLTRIRDRYGLEVFRRFFEQSWSGAPRPGWYGTSSFTSTPPRSRRTSPWSRSRPASPWSNTCRISSRKAHKSWPTTRTAQRERLPET